MIFLNSSIFLSVLLETEKADECEGILKKIEMDELKAVTTTHVLEETVFKLLIAKASEISGTKNLWEIRERLKRCEKTRNECYITLSRFIDYIKTLCFGGLRIMHTSQEDIFNIPSVFKETGLLTADCLHIATMKRLSLKKIATLDRDFKMLKGLVTIP